jgi:hypothetical protein
VGKLAVNAEPATNRPLFDTQLFTHGRTATRRCAGLSSSLSDDLEGLDIECLVGEDLVEPVVLVFELLEPHQVTRLEPAVLRAPRVERSQRSDAREVAWVLEDALIQRFGTLPNGDANVALRTDNALVYASVLCRALAKSYGLRQEFILPHTPEPNGVDESFMDILKLKCM